MIDKQIKSKILNFYKKKQDKMLVSMIIEKVNKFETGNHLIYTTFLNMYEKEIAISVLNKLIQLVLRREDCCVSNRFCFTYSNL